MKEFGYIALLILFSCNNQNKQTKSLSTEENKSTAYNKTDNSKYYTTKDTIIIAIENSDTLKYSKQDFNKIVESHSEFFQEVPQNPELCYYMNGDIGEFGSEIGQDNYYMLYAYFLKKRNGENEFLEQRNRLIEIYSGINSLFGYIEYGGTYFGHQHSRLYGYAEYSVYLLPKKKEDFDKTYDITKQKKFYIESLRQLIADESKIDFNTLGKEKVERNIELNKIVDKLDGAITDIYYLRSAQEFQYSHYQYF